jgi:DNA invertase Pin-like site-specific DNA recombinase
MENRKRKAVLANIDNLVQDINNVKLNNNSAIIYTRISSPRQITGSSLQSQKLICEDYCKKLKLVIKNNIEEVCSAVSMSKQSKLNEIIINNHNIHLIILEPSRLSRNIKDFTALLEKCEQNKITLHFAQSNIISNNTQDIKNIISSVFDAEVESKTLGKRIKTSIQYRKRMKTFIPSVPSFGYMNKDKKLCECEKEQDIIKLINKLFWGSDTHSINELIFKITGIQDEICYLNDLDEVLEIKYGNMRIIDIVKFLNNLDISSRNRLWNSNSISKLIKN